MAMGAEEIRLRDRGRRLGRMRHRQPALRRPSHHGPGPRGRPLRLADRPVHPHAGRAAVPDRQPVLRLAYETDPEPELNGRKVFHARGKVLGGSSSINGMIFQRGNPMDYERWAAEPGMKEWDYLHCLPYFKRMENCLAGADEWRGGDGPLKLERGPGHEPAVRGVLRGGAAGRLPAHRRRERLPAGGLRAASTATSTAAAGCPPRAPTCTRSGTGRTSRSRPWRWSPASGSTASGPSASTIDAAARLRRTVDAGEVILCGGAINTPQLMQLSGVGDQALLSAARRPGGAPPARRRREPAGPPRGLHPVRLQAAGVDRARAEVAPPPGHRLPVARSTAAGWARPTTSRAAASLAATTTSTTRT